MSTTTNDDDYHPLYSNALGSATAGIVSRIFTHPLDTAKARLQGPPTSTINPPYNGVRDVLIRTYRSQGGISNWYRGFGAVVVGGTPGTMLYFCSYEWIKGKLSTASSARAGSPMPDFAIYFASGMLAEAIACIIYVPVDVIKERLQVQTTQTVADTITSNNKNTQIMRSATASSTSTSTSSSGYNGSLDALKKILKTEGIRGIYKGYGATLASFGPFSSFYFLFYEQFKVWSRSNTCLELFDPGTRKNSNNDEERKGAELPFPNVVFCSASAGAAASFITSPLDMAKLRLQIQRSVSNSSSQPSNNHLHNGMIDCLVGIFQRDGIRGLFRGAGARVVHFTPATMITMTCFETCRSFFSTHVH